MQLSFLFNCDDVASPALKVDPDMQIAHVVPRTERSARGRALEAVPVR